MNGSNDELEKKKSNPQLSTHHGDANESELVCIHRKQLSSTMQNNLNMIMEFREESRQEWSSNTTGSLEIFNETKANFRIKRICTNALDCQRPKAVTAEKRIPMLILRMSSNYAFAKRIKSVKVPLSHCDSSH